MEKLQVLVVDNDMKVMDELNANKENEYFEIIASSEDGRTGMKLIQTLNPDVIVLELLMPYMDGFAILESMKNSKAMVKKPIVIVTSTMASEGIVKEVFKLGADYFMVKPYDVSLLVKRIEKIQQERSGDRLVELSFNIETIIESQLLGLGIPASLKGYRYIVSAVKEVINEPTMIYGVTKVLYPEIAKKHKSTAIRVEKSIRHAIEVAWDRNGSSEMVKILGNQNRNQKRPTNSEFIALVAQKIKPVA